MMYSSHAVLWFDFVLFVVLSFISSSLCFSNAVQINYKGHTSITLYQGASKFYLDATDCPVGVSFVQPERFSCACINGIWAFYENPCQAPVAIVGGYNHCFQMPSHPIRMALAVTNPLRALGESLTVFENNMEGIQSKMYRNMHMGLSGTDKFVSLNSSWTLTSPDGTKSVCLETKIAVFEGLTTEDAMQFPNLTYCSYTGLAEEMPFIGTVKKGCNSSMVLEPVQCQPMLPNNGEDVCMNEEILKEFQKSHILESEVENDVDYENVHVRPSRALKNLGRFLENNNTQSPLDDSGDDAMLGTKEEVVSAYKGEPEWHRRWTALKGSSSSSNQTSSLSSAPALVSTETKKIDLEKAWENPRIFLAPPTANSNSLVTNYLWMFRRLEFRKVLNISRLIPPEDDLPVQLESGKIKKLFGVHKDIIKKICPLVSPYFFDTIVGTFLGLLAKGFRWNEPYLGQIPYLRILTSLSLCRKKAVMMKFAQSTQCGYQNTGYISLPSSEGNETVMAKLDIPEVFRTGSHEPLIEAAWKIFISVHSYCFKDFKGQFQDHHKYTMLMMGLFSNKLHDIWVRNRTSAIEYAGVLGNIQIVMDGLERCATGARMTSEYPFHMNRPAMLSKYQEENFEMGSHSRIKRSAFDNPQMDGNWMNKIINVKLAEEEVSPSLNRKKRLTVHTVNSENKIGNTVFSGRGVCLKKYNDHKIAGGIHCGRKYS